MSPGLGASLGSLGPFLAGLGFPASFHRECNLLISLSGTENTDVQRKEEVTISLYLHSEEIDIFAHGW
jgi:hypothetical protein